MSLAILYRAPTTPEELALWSFAHAASHRDLNRVIYETDGTRLDDYVLDPFDPANEAEMASWLNLHQIMHRQMDEILGISGFDLLAVDWANQSGLAAWIAQHGTEHAIANRILNLG